MRSLCWILWSWEDPMPVGGAPVLWVYSLWNTQSWEGAECEAEDADRHTVSRSWRECGGINGAVQVAMLLLLLWIFELLSLIQNAALSPDLHRLKSVHLVERGTALFTVDAVRRYFQKYHLQQTYHFRTIPADKRIAPAVVHCVKGHLYSAAGEVLGLYSIAPAEELCVKGHSCTHIHLCTQDCSWQEPQQVAFRVWRTDWVNPGQRDCKLCSGIISEWCPRDMLYDSSVSEQRRSEELELLRSTLSGIDESYSWRQVKELLQERVFLQCEKFGT